MTFKLTTHFGFKTINKTEKATMVKNLFSNVADKYDLMNDAMSFGAHRVWKNALINWLNPQANQLLLDIAGGTGDIAFRFLARTENTRACVFDITADMLTIGRARADILNLAQRVNWIQGDAMDMPFSDATFDYATISFGIRNFTHPQQALTETLRVLKPGGRLLILEFSQLSNAALQQIYDNYSFSIIPRLGKIIANDMDSYRYLVESIRKFPDQDSFATIIRSSGFAQVKYRNLSFGIAALHSGWKL